MPPEDGDRSAASERRTFRTPLREGHAADNEGKPVLLAWARDGKPMADEALRLVVPGDRRGGRNARDVVRIALR